MTFLQGTQNFEVILLTPTSQTSSVYKRRHRLHSIMHWTIRLTGNIGQGSIANTVYSIARVLQYFF